MSRFSTFALTLVCALSLAGPAHADGGADGAAPSTVEPPAATQDPVPDPVPVPVPVPDPQPAGPLRILITGDSITQGFHGDYSWRYRLDKEFDRQKVNVDLVGSRTKPYAAGGWTGATYADPKFDQNHFAFAGTTLLQQSGWIAQEVRQQHPDLIVVASGVNDMRHGSTPAQTLAHFRAWVTAVRQAAPHVDIIVSPVLGAVGNGLPHLAADIVKYDAMLPAEIARLTSQDSPITLADTTFGWNVNTFTVENLHPNPTGETHIAQRIAETMHLLGILPATPMIYRAQTWTRTERATVTLRDNQAILRWPDHVISGAKVYVHRRGGRSTISRVAYRGGVHVVTGLTYGATYDFRLQLTRVRLVGPWGPITRVKVNRPVRPTAVSKVTVNAGGVRWTAAPRATSYRVQMRKAGQKTWTTQTTRALVLLKRNVVAAKVTAVNGGGLSAARLGVR